MNRDVYVRRLEICQRCYAWLGQCLKGHLVTSPTGCPERRFDPVDGADYDPDVPLRSVSTTCCGQS